MIIATISLDSLRTTEENRATKELELIERRRHFKEVINSGSKLMGHTSRLHFHMEDFAEIWEMVRS